MVSERQGRAQVDSSIRRGGADGRAGGRPGMNMVLFRPGEAEGLIGPSDERVIHIRRILKKGPGDEVLAGVENGPIGKARILSLDPEGARFAFTPEREGEPLKNLCLILGFPRPIQANRILKDLASLGLRRILLSPTELGEKSYAAGSFFSEGGWERAIREGACQAASPLLPRVDGYAGLEAAVEAARPESGRKIYLDAANSPPPLSRAELDPDKGAVLAIGSERGWTDRERRFLEAAGFEARGLGSRILRTETAAVAAAAICLAAMGEM
jgi:RsmE family RNA methyltransferase